MIAWCWSKGCGMPPPTLPLTGQRDVRFAAYLRRTFGCRVHQISIDAGFPCPNRDGMVAFGGYSEASTLAHYRTILRQAQAERHVIRQMEAIPKVP